MIIESRDVIFYENRFSSTGRQRNLHISTDENVELENVQQENPQENDVDNDQQIVLQYVLLEQEDIPRRSKIHRKAKFFGLDFHVYLVEGTRNDIHSGVPYFLNEERDPLTYSDDMASQDSSF